MVSVIIPKRRGENIDECKLHVYMSTYTDIEVIVVDEGLERSRQRNIGIERAKGEYLLILDSDQLIHKDLIKHCVDVCNQKTPPNKRGGFLVPQEFASAVRGILYGFNALYIPETIVTPGWFGRLRNWERQFYNSTAVDAVRFVKADGCPFFDEDMSGPEDSDWDRRVDGPKGISYWPLYHKDNVGVIGYFKKKAYYAKSMAQFKNNRPGDKVTTFKWRCWTVFTEHGKWKRLISHPFMSLGLFVLIGIRGVIYLCAKKS